MDKAALALAIVGVVLGGAAWVAITVVLFYLGRHR